MTGRGDDSDPFIEEGRDTLARANLVLRHQASGGSLRAVVPHLGDRVQPQIRHPRSEQLREFLRNLNDQPPSGGAASRGEHGRGHLLVKSGQW